MKMATTLEDTLSQLQGVLGEQGSGGFLDTLLGDPFGKGVSLPTSGLGSAAGTNLDIGALQNLGAESAGIGSQLSDLSNQVLTGQNIAELRNLGLDIENQFGEIQQGLGSVGGRLGGISSGLGSINTGLGGISSGVGDVSQRFSQDFGGLQQNLRGVLEGGNDPRFEAFRQAQNEQLLEEQERQQAQTSDFFGRRGIGGSSAALTELQNQGTGFAQQRRQLGAQLGLQQLGRQDTALQQLLGAAGQRAGIESGLLGQQQGILGQQQNVFGQQAGIEGQRAGILGQQANLQGQRAQTQLGLQQGVLQQGQFQQGLLGQQQSALGLQSGLLGQQQALGQQHIQNVFGAQQAQNLAQQGNIDAATAALENLTIPAQLALAQEAILAQTAAAPSAPSEPPPQATQPGSSTTAEILEDQKRQEKKR